MKKILLIVGILVCLTTVQVLFAQSPEGVISYEVKVNMHRRLPPEREAMKSMIPEYNVSKDILFFNTTESLYKPVEEEDDDFANDGGGMRMRFRRPQAEHYFNQTTGKRIMQQDFMGKKYLVEDSIKILPWKFGTETKTVSGYECKQATYYNEERKQTVVAWYTDKLRPFLGPENFNALPGTVLQIDINDGERVITAQKIESRPLKKNELKVPSGGQRTTDAEYRKIVEEQMEKMRANGGMVIRN